jgi:hypothetical protein
VRCLHGRQLDPQQTLRPAGLDWITALRASTIRQLAEGGLLQFSLFGTRDMAEISSPDYPDERLVVCKNPLLAEEQRRKRDELLALTETDLGKIQARVGREKNPLRGAAEIGKAVGAVLSKRKMAKHFELTITDTVFSVTRNTEAVAEEARFDGFYVLRTSLPVELADAARTVRAYKSLVQVERAFRLHQDGRSGTAAGVSLDRATGAGACPAVYAGVLSRMAHASALGADVVR